MELIFLWEKDTINNEINKQDNSDCYAYYESVQWRSNWWVLKEDITLLLWAGKASAELMFEPNLKKWLIIGHINEILMYEAGFRYA